MIVTRDTKHPDTQRQIREDIEKLKAEKLVTRAQAIAAGAEVLTYPYPTRCFATAAALLAVVNDFRGSSRRLFAVEPEEGSIELWVAPLPIAPPPKTLSRGRVDFSRKPSASPRKKASIVDNGKRRVLREAPAESHPWRA